MKKLIIVMVVMLTGCMSSEMTTTKTATDGSKISYRAKIHSVGQDLKGSDLAASLDPSGKTTVKAGAIDNTTSQVTADVAVSMVDLVKALLPYIGTPVE
ncbi:MAG: hypothetical protein ACYSSI_00335 [Planctomycetota bacterium]|jgi:hypothetical protein